MKKILFFLITMFAVQVYSSDIEERKGHIKKMEAKVSQLSEKRKQRSEIILNKYGVPINNYLPYIEDENEALVRNKTDIAMRAMTLLIVAVKAEGLEQEIVESLIKGYRLESSLTPNEKKFLYDPSPSEHDKTQFIWRYEAAWVLLWALGYVSELEFPGAICDVPFAVSVLQQRSSDQFISDAKLKPIASILDEADLIYRYHWAVRDAQINGKPSPSGIDSSVVVERHYALNWLIGYMDQEWDDVSTDT